MPWIFSTCRLVANTRLAAAQTIYAVAYQMEWPSSDITVHVETLLRSVESRENTCPLVKEMSEPFGLMEGSRQYLRGLRRE